MPKYKLTQAADDDLTELYSFTYAEFGEHQADAYFESLENCLAHLAENPQLGLAVEFVRASYRRFVHKRHSIYYKILKSEILVVRLLGPGMSPERNLP